jgi:hypothetical protein
MSSGHQVIALWPTIGMQPNIVRLWPRQVARRRESHRRGVPFLHRRSGHIGATPVEGESGIHECHRSAWCRSAGSRRRNGHSSGLFGLSSAAVPLFKQDRYAAFGTWAPRRGHAPARVVISGTAPARNCYFATLGGVCDETLSAWRVMRGGRVRLRAPDATSRSPTRAVGRKRVEEDLVAWPLKAPRLCPRLCLGLCLKLCPETIRSEPIWTYANNLRT